MALSQETLASWARECMAAATEHFGSADGCPPESAEISPILGEIVEAAGTAIR